MEGWRNLGLGDVEDLVAIIDKFLFNIYHTSITAATEPQIKRVMYIIENL